MLKNKQVNKKLQHNSVFVTVQGSKQTMKS